MLRRRRSTLEKIKDAVPDRSDVESKLREIVAEGSEVERRLRDVVPDTARVRSKIKDAAPDMSRVEKRIRSALPETKAQKRKRRLPYVLLLVVAGIGAFVILRKRIKEMQDDGSNDFAYSNSNWQANQAPSAAPASIYDSETNASPSSSVPGYMDRGVSAQPLDYTDTYRDLVGRKVTDVDGDEIGTVDAVFTRDTSMEPEWIVVRSGLITDRLALVPLDGATIEDEIKVPYFKDLIESAPEVEDVSIDAKVENSLYVHYNLRRTSHLEHGESLPALKRWSPPEETRL